jgi:DUF1009 family protein
VVLEGVAERHAPAEKSITPNSHTRLLNALNVAAVAVAVAVGHAAVVEDHAVMAGTAIERTAPIVATHVTAWETILITTQTFQFTPGG